MKISIDAFNMSLEHGTGVATYGRTLVRAAASLGHDVGVLYGSAAAGSSVALLNEIALIDGSRLAANPAKRWQRLREGLATSRALFGPLHGLEVQRSGQVIVPPGQRLGAASSWDIKNLYRRANGLYRRTGIATEVDIQGLELAHWTYPLPIAAKRAKNVYTLHDLVPLKLPYTTADHKRHYYHLCMRIARRADHIITVSEASKRDIIDILGVAEDRVTNTYQSVDVHDLVDNLDESTIDTYVRGLLNLEMRGYFLFFGAIEPKKNVARLLEAYLGSGTRTPLVVVGAPGWGGESDTKLLASLKALDSHGKIIWLTYLPRNMLVMLIAGARATLFPSLYEGFGLPVAESMALGTPVITSNTSSLPEVAGNAAVLIDPYSANSIASAIKNIDDDESIRADLSRRGRQQAQKFSVKVYSDRLRAFYSGIS